MHFPRVMFLNELLFKNQVPPGVPPNTSAWTSFKDITVELALNEVFRETLGETWIMHATALISPSLDSWCGNVCFAVIFIVIFSCHKQQCCFNKLWSISTMFAMNLDSSTTWLKQWAGEGENLCVRAYISQIPFSRQWLQFVPTFHFRLFFDISNIKNELNVFLVSVLISALFIKYTTCSSLIRHTYSPSEYLQ